MVLHSGIALLIAAFAAWILATLGWRLGSVKGRQVIAAAGLSRILAPPPSPPQGHALLVDSSAVMDRFLLVLGRGGLLPAGLILPQFVIDHVRSVADMSDPVTSRRARRGLESIEALREMGVSRYTSPPTRSPKSTTRPSSCSPWPGGWDCASGPVPPPWSTKPGAGNYRWSTSGDVAQALSPDHLPGEELQLELIKEGRQPRQAIGYLSDGDMVVVNDATHLIDQGPVRVSVLSTRPTSQGVIVFAKLATEGEPLVSPVDVLR